MFIGVDEIAQHVHFTSYSTLLALLYLYLMLFKRRQEHLHYNIIGT